MDPLPNAQIDESLFRQIADAVPQVVWMANAEGKVEYFNSRAQELAGLRRDETTNEWIWRPVVYAPDLAETERKWQEAIRSGTLYEVENRLLMADGSIRWHLSRGVPVRDANGAVVRWFGCATDIHDLKCAQDELRQREFALRESEERFRLFMTHSPAAGWIADQENVIRYVSPGYFRLFGFDAIREGQSIETGCPPELAAEYIRNNQQVLRSGQLLETVEKGLRPDGTPGEFLVIKFPIRVSPTECLLGAIAVDITERSRTERRLQESLDLFQATFENAAVGIAHVGLDGRWLRVNDRFCKILGYSLEQLQDLTFADVTHPDDLAEDWANARSLMAGEATHYSMEKRYIRGSGETIWVRLTASLVRTATGEPNYFIGIVEDVTERRAAEAELLVAKESAEAANRAKDEFLATLSHELRTPLTPILMISAFMERNEELSESLRKDFAVIRRNAALEAQLVDELLDLTRISRGKLRLDLRQCDFHETARQAFEMAQTAAAGRHLTFRDDLSATAFHGEADAVRLRQILSNLLSNAVKFTPAGGWIEFLSSNPEPDSILFQISDNGIGMSPEEIGRVFEAFTQGDHAARKGSGFGGLGLGLTIARELAQLHGGSIWATSPGRGSGSTFFARFPLIRPA